jgi:hypothetical protein
VVGVQSQCSSCYRHSYQSELSNQVFASNKQVAYGEMQVKYFRLISKEVHLRLLHNHILTKLGTKLVQLVQTWSHILNTCTYEPNVLTYK